MYNKKKRVIHFRAGSTEVECLRALCDFEDINMSEALRLAVREAAKSRGFWPRSAAENPKGDSA